MTNSAVDPERLTQAAFDAAEAPEIVVDAVGTIGAINAPARVVFALSSRDVGRPLRDLEVSYRPAELRGALDTVLEQRRAVSIPNVRWSYGGEARAYDVVLAPLNGHDGVPLGTRITYRDVTKVKQLEEQLERSRQEIETAYEELQSTNEELETTNEELQSTVEELETTNEELQSTNEELETMNEELQSTNEELQTMNEELRLRSTELHDSNGFLETVFRSLQSAVVVVDHEYRVLVWSPRAEDLWGLRPEEARETYFLNLDIGLPVEELRPGLRSVLKGERDHVDTVLAATSRRGKPISCRVSISALKEPDRSIAGAIMLMEEGTHHERHAQPRDQDGGGREPAGGDRSENR